MNDIHLREIDGTCFTLLLKVSKSFNRRTNKIVLVIKCCFCKWRVELKNIFRYLMLYKFHSIRKYITCFFLSWVKVFGGEFNTSQLNPFGVISQQGPSIPFLTHYNVKIRDFNSSSFWLTRKVRKLTSQELEILEKLVWKYEETCHANKPTRYKISSSLKLHIDRRGLLQKSS